jgi:adenine-specific DNA methylase
MNTKVRRNTWSVEKQFTEVVTHNHRFDSKAAITAGSAADASIRDLDGSQADLVITDPPYFDFIPYDRLSAFYRAWSTEPAIAGTPLLPSRADPAQSFGLGLGQALRRSAEMLSPNGLLAFTYHSADPGAWAAVGIAIDEAKVLVTGLWPVLADPHMGHHGTPGACQYDMVVVARPLSQVQSCLPPFGVDGGQAWLENMGLPLDGPDIASALLAYKVCEARWGVVPDANLSEGDAVRKSDRGVVDDS